MKLMQECGEGDLGTKGVGVKVGRVGAERNDIRPVIRSGRCRKKGKVVNAPCVAAQKGTFPFLHFGINCFLLEKSLGFVPRCDSSKNPQTGANIFFEKAL